MGESNQSSIKRIETDRLYLYPLELPQLEEAIRDADALCRRLGVEPGSPYGFFERHRRRPVYTAKRVIVRDQPRSWLLATTWFIVLKETMTLAGEAGFKGPPSVGEIEIGYGLKTEARGKGYMAEAVEMLCRIAFAQTEYAVRTVSAKTLPDNIKSHQVLEKNGFTRDGEIGKYWRWVKRLKDMKECP